MVFQAKSPDRFSFTKQDCLKDNKIALYSRGGIVIHTICDKKLLMLKPKQIRISRIRKFNLEKGEEINNLASSIALNGIIEPLCVRKREDGGFELISGFRRLQAAKMVGLRRVPCVVHKAEDMDAEIYFLIENMQRKQPSYFEEALTIRNIIDSFIISEKELAIRLGIPQYTLLSKLSLLRFSEQHRERITEANLSEYQARSLIRLSERQREAAIEYIINEQLNDKQTEKLVTDIYSGKFERKEEPEKPIRKYAIGDVRLFSNSLSKLVSTLQNAGMDASYKKYENNKYVEYKIRIKKENRSDDSAVQLKIC